MWLCANNSTIGSEMQTVNGDDLQRLEINEARMCNISLDVLESVNVLTEKLGIRGIM